MNKYIIKDVRTYEPPKKANVMCVDLAWARPNRAGVYVTYPTYKPGNGLWDFVDWVYQNLEKGGWAFFDCDDWFLPRLINYLQENWGDVASTYRGGGYRRTGAVVYPTGGGGHYFTNAGYHVVMAHKGETSRKSSVKSKLCSERVDYKMRKQIEWGTLKPIKPYKQWLDSITTEKDLLICPCAGTAPSVLAYEQLYGDQAQWIAIDSEKDAKIAFEKRKKLGKNW